MTTRKNNRIGLFGGTFDPIHHGHLILAEHVRRQCQLDQILLIPAKIHPLKDNNSISAAEHRLRMLQIAVTDNPHLSISTLEIEQDKTSYTVDTLRQLMTLYPPGTEFKFLLGSDNVAQFHLWHQPEALLNLCQFFVFGRSGTEDAIKESPYGEQFEFVSTPLIEISSTDIRNRCARQLSIRYLVPHTVRKYIIQYQLYGCK